MYKYRKAVKSKIKGLESYEGEFLESKLERVVNSNEAITDGAPIIYTEKNKGVQAQFDHRTDKWEIAAEGMDVVHKGQESEFYINRVQKNAENVNPGINKDNNNSESMDDSNGASDSSVQD